MTTWHNTTDMHWTTMRWPFRTMLRQNKGARCLGAGSKSQRHAETLAAAPGSCVEAVVKHGGMKSRSLWGDWLAEATVCPRVLVPWAN